MFTAAKKLLSVLDRYFEPVLIVTLVLLIVLIVFLQIVCRLLGASLSSAEEIARFMFVWAMYLSISYAIRDDRHIRISVLVDKLPPGGQLFLRNCADLIFLVYSAVVVGYGWVVIKSVIELGQIAPATEVSVAVVYFSVFVGSLLNIYRLGWRLVNRARGAECALAEGNLL